MKKLLFLVPSLISLFSYGQQTDAANTSQFNVIRNEQNAGGNTRARVADAYQVLNDSKVNRAECVTTTGTTDYSITINNTVVDYSRKVQALVQFVNPNGGASTLNINGHGPVPIKKTVTTDLAPNDIVANMISWVVYDGTNFQILTTATTSTALFSNDIVVSLSGGKLLGPYSNGQTIPSAGKTAEQVINLLATEYQNPSWNSFSVSGAGIAPTVQVGTSMPASGTFTWSISANSGVVSTIDILDVTASGAIQTNVSNTGTYTHNLNANQLNTDGATQVWRGVLHDTGGVSQNINSPAYTVTARFIRYYGSASASVTNSTTVKALPSHTEFQTSGAIFNLPTGTTLTKFIVCLPPGVTIVSVIDLDAFSSNITSQYVQQSNINVTDAGGTNRSYNIYECNSGVAYSTSHRHQVTTN